MAIKVEHVAKGREKDMAGTMRGLTEEHAASTAALRHERGERDRLRAELEESRRRELDLNEQLRHEQAGRGGGYTMTLVPLTILSGF